jgi:hypothetical protein
MLSHPPPDEEPAARELRGKLFTDLDRLAFALELEGGELLRAGREREAELRQEMRLGVRLAQRIVAGIWADEAQGRVRDRAPEFDERMERGQEPRGAAP